MNTTSHYQLNQWDGPDRILRTDFNADNLKTDDAIAAVREACPIVKLVEVSISEDTAQFDVDMSAFSLTDYDMWMIRPRILSSESTYYLRCNNVSSNYEHGGGRETYLHVLSGSGNNGINQIDLTYNGNYLYSFIRKAYYAGMGFHYESDACRTSKPSPAELNALNFVAGDSGVLRAGSIVRIYGVKL